MAHIANIQQVQFKDCLQPIPVPSQILKGIKVTRVDGVSAKLWMNIEETCHSVNRSRVVDTVKTHSTEESGVILPIIGIKILYQHFLPSFS